MTYSLDSGLFQDKLLKAQMQYKTRKIHFLMECKHGWERSIGTVKFGHIGNLSGTGGQRVQNRAAYNAPVVVQPPQASSIQFYRPRPSAASNLALVVTPVKFDSKFDDRQIKFIIKRDFPSFWILVFETSRKPNFWYILQLDLKKN